jgi:hypothetical protein
MGRRRVDSSTEVESLDLPLQGGGGAPVFLLFAPPIRGLYGLSRAHAIKCQEEVDLGARISRQCRRYARDMVKGVPLCKRHAKERRHGAR